MRISIPIDAPELDTITVQLASVTSRLASIEEKIVATQQQINDIAAALSAIGDDLSAGVQSLQGALAGLTSDIETLSAEASVDVGPVRDRVAALTQAAQQISDAATGLTNLDAENPPPAGG